MAAARKPDDQKETKNLATDNSEADKHWLVRQKTIRLLWIALAVILVATVVAGFLVHPHVYFGIDGTPAFYAWFGLGSCIAMVLIAKALGVLIKRPDDYYDAE